MLSRREYEEFHGKVSDETWSKIQQQMNEIADLIWNEDHPLDD